MEVGARLTELREQKGITVNKLANLAGISQSYLRDVELGNKNPTIETLSYFCDALGVSLKEFFDNEKNGLNPFLKSELTRLTDAQQIKLAEFIKTIK